MSNLKFRILLRFILFMGIISSVFGQKTAQVVSSDTKIPIPYVNIWISDTDWGTTSNIDGEFTIADIGENEKLVLSALGYETLSIKLSELIKTIELKPKSIDLEEVVVYAKENTKELKVSEYKTSKVNNLYASGMQPKIRARFFPYKTEFELTPYLKMLKMTAPSEIEKAKFILRFYTVGKNGGPGEPIHDKNVFGYGNKKSWTTEINLYDYDIRFPEEGMFIAVEWLIIDENLYEYPVGKGKKKEMVKAYAPMFGTLITKTNNNSWIYAQGKWVKAENNEKKSFGRRLSKKYSVLAMELTLSN